MPPNKQRLTVWNLRKCSTKSALSDYLSLLNSERDYQQARIDQIKAQATRYADTAALFQALGGGWWNRAGFVRRLIGASKRKINLGRKND